MPHTGNRESGCKCISKRYTFPENLRDIEYIITTFNSQPADTSLCTLQHSVQFLDTSRAVMERNGTIAAIRPPGRRCKGCICSSPPRFRTSFHRLVQPLDSPFSRKFKARLLMHATERCHRIFSKVLFQGWVWVRR